MSLCAHCEGPIPEAGSSDGPPQRFCCYGCRLLGERPKRNGSPDSTGGNAVFRVVPRALITPVYEAAKRVAVGDVKSLTTKRAQIIARLKQMGAKDSAILAAVGAEKTEDIDLAKLEVLIGLGTAIKDGEITLETAFPGASPKEEGKPIFKEEPKPVEPAPVTPEKVQTAQTASEPVGTPQERLATIVTQCGFTLEQFSEWCIAIGFHTVAITGWSEVTDQVANRILRSPSGLITQLKGVAK
jgi:hypothetical protein